MRFFMLGLALTACGGGGPASASSKPAHGVGGDGAVAVDGSAHSGDVIEIRTTPFSLGPGEETLKCIYTSLPADEAVSIERLDSTMSVGSHHLILFFSAERNQPDGTVQDCTVLPSGAVAGQFVPLPLYLTQKPRDSLSMPQGVAMQLAARQPVLIELHSLNTTTEPLDVSATIVATLAHGAVQPAALFASYNKLIAVPPHGSQEISGHCSVPSGAQFFRMTTHAHSHMTSAMIGRYRNGQVVEELLRSTDWESPAVRDWSAPYFTFADGDELTYSCSYDNSGDTVVLEGQSARTNEMCMAIGYFFPAVAPSVCLNSTP